MDTIQKQKETFVQKIKRLIKLGIGVFFGIIVLVIILASIGGNDSPSSTSQAPVVTQPVTSTASVPEKPQRTAMQAQKELDEFMALAKKAELVTTYEFSDKASVVYVGKVWYTQTVQMKKDFLAYISMIKKDITGYNHFVVRDAYSDEKVAEVTAFSKSLEVYK